MSAPLEIPLTGRRRVLCDVDGGRWRVAYYRPALEGPYVHELERKAQAGSGAAAKDLDALKTIRRTGSAPTLVAALQAAGKGSLSLAECRQVSEYVLSAKYAQPAA